MLEIRFIGRLGNQMFQYATCRTLAEEKGYKYFVTKHDWDGGCLFDIDFGGIDGTITHHYKEDMINYHYESRIKNIQDNTLLCGFFQSEKYFDVKKARQWYRVRQGEDRAYNSVVDQYPQNEYCYLNIRGGDYIKHGCHILPMEYYSLAIDKMLSINDKLKFIVVTDDEGYARQCFPDLPMVHNSMRTDFLLMNRAQYVIIANSTFAWWAAWLNESGVVIAPHGWLSVKDRTKFIPGDIKTDRFIWI